MSAEDPSSAAEPVVLPDGSLRCGRREIAPWPSLQISPPRGFLHGDELLHPGVDTFTRRIPPAILRRVRDFPEHHWHLLELCAGHPARGFELLAENPALAMLTVEHCRTPAAQLRRRDLTKLIHRPWRGLLADLGMPTRPRTIRILRKLPIGHCSVATVTRLRRVLRTSGHRWVHMLPHLTHLTRDTVGLLLQDPQVITSDLIRATLGSPPEVETVSWLCSSISGLRAELGQTGAWPYRGLDLEQLKLVEDRLKRQTAPDFFAAFPAAPIPGEAGVIVPIREFMDLAEEGDRQANCSVMYLSSILANEAYVYRLLRPERATFVLQRNGPNGPWALSDLRCYNNSTPSDATVAFVKRWVDDARVATDSKP